MLIKTNVLEYPYSTTCVFIATVVLCINNTRNGWRDGLITAVALCEDMGKSSLGHPPLSLKVIEFCIVLRFVNLYCLNQYPHYFEWYRLLC